MKAKTSPHQKPRKSDSKGVQPRNRIKYSANQLLMLEKAFLSTQYPGSSILEDLSNTISVSVERLSIWFQNRRSKFKRQSKDSHVTWMRQQIFQQGSGRSHGARSQTARGTGHVLSPPSQNATQQETTSKPSTNLHYIPSAAPSCSRLPEYDPYALMTSTQPSTSDFHESVYYNPQSIPTSDYSINHLFPHIIPDMPDQSPYYPPPISGFYGQTNYTSHVENQYYQSYSPYYNFPSNQMTFPEVGV